MPPAGTLVPVLILLTIGIFSLPALFRSQEMPADPDLVIKAIGHQWYWSYEYPNDGIAFDALMLEKDALAEAGLSIPGDVAVIGFDDLPALQTGLEAAHKAGKAAIKAVRGDLPVGGPPRGDLSPPRSPGDPRRAAHGWS